MIRSFIAMPLAPPVEDRLAGIISECRSEGDGVKWVAPGNIHLTLRFLGDTDESLVPKISGLIDKIGREFSAVETVLDRLGAFPNLRKPRVFWIGVGSDDDNLAKIARQIELKVRELRFQKEKKGFRAHLTLGRVRHPDRVKNLAAFLEDYQLAPIPVLFDRIVLFKSTLTPRGPIYDRLHTTMLGQQTFGG